MLIVVGLSLLLALALSWARRDWEYELHLVLSLENLDWLDCPRGDLATTEVLLALSDQPPIVDELVLRHAGSVSGETILFHVEQALGDRVQLCSCWRDDVTPLLLALDDEGAVLYGPGGQFVGQLIDGGRGAREGVEFVEGR